MKRWFRFLRHGHFIRRGMWRVHGLTLVELLMVVGILMVVASLALPNFQDAVTRARVARVRADFTTYAMAIEAYRVDHNTVPRMRHWDFYQDPHFDVLFDEPVYGLLSQVLTTPVAYVSNVLALDPFMEKEQLAPLDIRLYTYQDLATYCARNPDSKYWPKVRDFYGDWRMASVGPDRTFIQGNIKYGANLPYDPTNGILSAGNIWRSAKWIETPLPPIPDLLGTH